MGYYKVTSKTPESIVLKHNVDQDGNPQDEIHFVRPPDWEARQVEEGGVYVVSLSFSKVDPATASQSSFPEA